MKAFLNPLLLVLCILLLAFGYVADSGEAMVETLVLTCCLLAVVINGTLGTARAMTGQPSLHVIGWAVGFLIFGSTVWTIVSAEGMESMSAQERVLLQERVRAQKAGKLTPFEVDENGDCIVTLAAGLGKTAILREVVTPGAAMLHADVVARATHRAAERNREDSLEHFLLRAYVPVDVRLEGLTPLHTACLSKARRAAAYLLECGADANAATPDGTTPLHEAVLAEDVKLVRLLRRHGADPTRCDADGRDAASYARTEAMTRALAAPVASPAP